jgi:hypothetical protein
MPVMTGVQGYTGLTQQTRLVLEPIPGEQLLMPQTVGASTMSLVTQPSAISPTTGMALHFFVIGNATAGTVVIAGTGPTGNTITSQTYHVNIAPQNNQGYTEFTTKEVFGTVNASGITVAGITPCQIIVFGSYAGKFLLPITTDAEEKIGHFSPQDKRGILAKNFRVTQLTKGASLDKFDCALYPDSLWMPYMLIGNSPNVTTVPAVPSVLLAATAKATTMTLTTGPSAPGMFLVFTLAANTLAGTIVLTGLDNYGAPATETIAIGTSQTTVYSSRRYSSLTVPGSLQFATTGLSVGATIAVSGVFAWTYTFTYDGVTNYTPYSATLEMYNGVFGYKLPYTFLSDGDFSWEKEKEISFTGKGEAQDYLIIGDPTSTSSGINPFASLAQPTSLPVVSWPSSFFIDTGSGTPFTTQDGSLESFKIAIATGRKSFYSGDGFQRWSNVTWDSEPDVALDATIILQNYANYINFFKPNQALILGATFTGNLLGTISGTTYYENWSWTTPARVDSWKNDSSKNPVEGTLKLLSEYNFSNLGYLYRLAVTCQQPPTYVA